MRNTVAAAAALATVATASLAFAQVNGNKNAPSLYGIYDSRGAFVGTLTYGGMFRVFDNKTPYLLDRTLPSFEHKPLI
jgi:hypothetical protein